MFIEHGFEIINTTLKPSIFKACVFFIFHQEKALKRLRKVFFYLECSFRYQDIQIFVTFHPLSRSIRLLEEVENGIILTSYDGFHTLPIAIFK